MYQLDQSTFSYKQRLFTYCINAHNTRGSLTERVVEIPLMQYFLQQYPETIEIGCVSPYYKSYKHKIYDLTDDHSSCCKQNAKDLDIINQNVLSISTIEHFDVENYNISVSERIHAMNYIKKIIDEAAHYLITIPLGYNMPLTSSILQYSDTNTNIVGFLSRDGNRWIEKKATKINEEDLDYNRQVWYANSIAIIENIL